jgi:hypothetical protein
LPDPGFPTYPDVNSGVNIRESPQRWLVSASQRLSHLKHFYFMKTILERIEMLLIALLEEIRGVRGYAGLRQELPPVVIAEVWLTKDAVMDLLCITESTFYRRLAECNWVRKKNGKEWYYLKSSII